MKERLIPTRSLRLALLALALASGVCLVMIVARTMFFQPLEFQGLYRRIELRGLIWNLFLAWIPLALALLIHTLSRRVKRGFIPLGICGIVWFLFFPNAPYLVTDLVHWKKHLLVPKWFDLLMIMSFAWTGLLLVRRRMGRTGSWSFVVLVLALSSFGIYLGRFLRLNSWDVFSRPLGVLDDVAQSADFTRFPEPMAFSAMFFAFSFLSYLTLFTLTHLHGLGEPARLDLVSSSLPPRENV